MSLAGLLGISETEETKQCGMCKEHKSHLDFGRDGGKHGYLRYECRACARKQIRIINEIRKTAPPIPKDHACPICLRTKDEILTNGSKKRGPWVLDHDHKTNKFRGYLCHKCNLGIGQLGEDIERLNRAIKYVENG